jgi:hypothetical protein
MFDRISEHPLTWFAMGILYGWLARGDFMQGFWKGLTQ